MTWIIAQYRHYTIDKYGLFNFISHSIAGFRCNIIGSSKELTSEIEKLHLAITHIDEIIERLKQEVTHLNEINDLLKKQQ